MRHTGQAASGAVVTAASRTKSGPTKREVMLRPTGAAHAGIVMTDALQALAIRENRSF